MEFLKQPHVDNAKLKVKKAIAKGQSITLVKALTDDVMGEATSESDLSLKAFPVRFAPFNRKQIMKVSWSLDVDVIIYLSKLDIEQRSMDLDDLAEYKQMVVLGKTYDVYKVEPYGTMADDYLYYIIGGKRI